MQNIAHFNDQTTTLQRLHGTNADRLSLSFKIALYAVIVLFMVAGFCFGWDIVHAQDISSIILH